MNRRSVGFVPILAAVICALPVDDRVTVRLADGRRLIGSSMKRTGDSVALETPFGTLDFPAHRLRSQGPASESRAPAIEGRRVVALKWFRLTTDISADREQVYRRELDAFFARLLALHRIDPRRVARHAPFEIHVYRSRVDYKQIQARYADEMRRRKGRAFAEGVAGFYSPSRRGVYLWDGAAVAGDADIEVARHEVTHLANHLLSEQHGTRLPSWFDEGVAVYFSTWWGQGAEPEPHLASLHVVTADLQADRGRSSASLRAVPYDTFYAAEYAWGWALVHYVRTMDGGGRWPRLLRFLRGDDRTKSGDRFARALGFRTARLFDRAWHAALKRIPKQPAAGVAAMTLAAVRKQTPSKKACARYLRVGLSLLDKRLYDAAAVYLAAVVRGDPGAARAHLALAIATARQAGAPDHVAWPAAAMQHLDRAVRTDPLSAKARALAGLQREVAGAHEDAWRQLALATILSHEDEDVVDRSSAAIRVGAERMDAAVAQRTLADAAPHLAADIARGCVQYLHEEGDWKALEALLARRVESGRAGSDERRMLAELFAATDRFEPAIALYRALLRTETSWLELWLPYIETLAASGDRAAARQARDKAIECIDAAPEDWGILRQRIEALRLK